MPVIKRASGPTDVTQMDDDELAARLRELGVDVGPILGKYFNSSVAFDLIDKMQALCSVCSGVGIGGFSDLFKKIPHKIFPLMCKVHMKHFFVWFFFSLAK